MAITSSLLQTLTGYQEPPPVASDLLPLADSPDVHLVPATGLEYVQTALLNGVEWKGPLTLEQFLEREVQLQAAELTKDGRITGWILTSSKLPPNPDGSRPILASCETILIRGRVSHKGAGHDVQAHGVASVFTRPEHRGRGYAGRMMNDLGIRLETWQSTQGATNAFSVLYSDIGDKFYARHGWKTFESTHIHLETMSSRDYDDIKASFPPVKDLVATDLLNLPSVASMEQQLDQLSKADPSRPYCAIHPDVEHFAWHHTREEFLAMISGKEAPQIKGAIHPSSGLAIVWNRRYTSQPKDCQLHLLHVIIPTDSDASQDKGAILAALLLRAQKEAGDWAMNAGVEIWDPTEEVVAAAQVLKLDAHEKVQVITRDKEHLCCLRWTAGEKEDPVWMNKEKYGWC
ncbi:hypothetical protein B0A52_08182 [Exophiala mesophila]|uniref:LYC1 C-terminal domain-containing protein n=1 Tax=Exophiala mesophila TaxID=212818 RepID=A0A438MXI0_EXOME|nr:hypothetical protein B0A52_08182 [Exophiala mesophila]